ncbi:MAG: outer membrane beta-barrel protein [Akkermansia sp.]|nr:outer membrane beta-barrel protein [Akkermansia sp.]
MKKNLFVALCLLGSTPAFAGLPEAPVAVVPAPADAPCTLTLQYGIMHTDYTELPYDQLRAVPNVLYGLSIGAQWQVAQTGNFTHHVGASVGYYTGTQQNRFYNDGPLITVDTDVEVFPLLLTYNVEYKLNDKLTIYGGVRGGAIVRDTKLTANELHIENSDTSITPMLGLGVGARTFITEKLSFDIGYDFSLSFGEDCDFSNDYPHDYRAGCGSEGMRYYGTIKAGFSYSF